jgi:hypothetical protein
MIKLTATIKLKYVDEQPSLILTELTEHTKTAKCDLGNPGSGLGQAQQCGGVKPINGTPPPS